MRDRREVLKLLAGGTAVAAGATLITTSSAFADGGTSACRPTVGTVETPAELDAQMQSNGQDPAAIRLRISGNTNPGLTVSNGSCTGCTTNTPTRAYKWTLDTKPTGTYGVYTSRTDTTNLLDAWQSMSGTTPIAQNWFIKPTTGGTPAAGPYVARLTVRWTCSYTRNSVAKTAWRCVHYTFGFTLPGTTNNSSATPLVGSGSGDSTACDS